ncbi:MAG: hypothetical protein JJU20_00410 [Opitutales bacterium]|nr:hypothetical protein [Opitutales bacterium]
MKKLNNHLFEVNRMVHGLTASCLIGFVTVLVSELSAEPQHPGRTLDDPLWPEKAKMVSSTEGIIEAFWSRNGLAETRWQTEGPGLIERFWDRVEFRWDLEEETKADAHARIHRPYDLYIGDFEELVFRVNLSPDMEFKLIAENDSGQSFASDWTRGGLRHMEVAIPIEGERLSGVEIKFRADSADKTQTVELRWLMLRRPGIDWVGVTPDYERFIQRPSDPGFNPGLGVLLSEDEVDRLRELSTRAPYKDLIEAELAELKPWLEEKLDPVAPRYSLDAGWQAYGRPWDEGRSWDNRGLLQGYYGMLKRDPELLNDAARHLIRLAATDEWEEGFTTSSNFVEWAHSGFTFNTALIQSALLLDWVWDWLTPEGRAFVAQAMRDKGLAKIDQHRYNHANQGARFHKGIILARIALSQSRLGAPLDNRQILAELRSFESHFLKLINEDGTFVEEDGYGIGTLHIVLLNYIIIARATGLPINELIPERIVQSAHFHSDLHDELPHSVASFTAGILGENSLSRYHLSAAPLAWGDFYWNPAETAYFGLDWLWMEGVDAADVAEEEARSTLSYYPIGGWILRKSPEMSFTLDAGYWMKGGQTRPRKGNIEVSFAGEPFLIRRTSVSYRDPRFRATWRTRAFNTFKPKGKYQDGLNENERGAEVLAVESLKYVDAIEIDNHSAWLEGVDQGIRRLLYIEPGVLLVEDNYRFAEPGEGFQIWNSLDAIEDRGNGRYGIQFASGQAMLQLLNPESVNPIIAPNSVHRSGAVSDDGDGTLPVHSIRFETPSQKTHRVLTLISVWTGDERPELTQVTDGVVEVAGKDGVRIRIGYGDNVDHSASFGIKSDGQLTFVVHRGGEVIEAGAFGATYLRHCSRRMQSESAKLLLITEEDQ